MNRGVAGMASGRRDLLIRIEQRPEDEMPDPDSGAPTVQWTTLVASMPAGRESLRGWERQTANQTVAGYDQRWEINYRADMDPDLLDVPKLRRIVYGGRTLDIVSANQIGRRRGIELFTLGNGR